MKILIRGEIPKQKSKIKKCGYCKTVFSYTQEDRIMCGQGPDDWFYAVECPVCKIQIPTSIFDKKEK